jgi:GNAT superfamily N-acetyltransferase
MSRAGRPREGARGAKRTPLREGGAAAGDIVRTTNDPRSFTRTEKLKNGLAVTIRAMRPDDRDRIAGAVGKLDRDSVYSRLFSNRTELTDAALRRIMTVAPDRDVALLVTTGSGPEEIVIGSGRYVSAGGQGADRTAEVSFVVQENHRRLGIASRLFSHLADIARRRGIVAFEADVLAGNQAMLAVFVRSGLAMRRRRDGGVVHITLSLERGHP